MASDSVAESVLYDALSRPNWFACDCVPAAQSKSEKYLRRMCSSKGGIAGDFRKILSLHRLQSSASDNFYCDHGRLEIDNNAAERALRAVALGRKNYLFAGSDTGGGRAVAIYSLIGGCSCPHHFDAEQAGNKVCDANRRVEVGTVGYTLSTGVKFITEADRSVTTFLLPDEY